MRPVAFLVVLLAGCCHGGLLGAGTGGGSCAAAPFRSTSLQWPLGCPESAPCCSEFGYCQIEANWHAGLFRDCNGVSNGRPLEPAAIAAENQAIATGDSRGANLLVVPAGSSTVTVPAASRNDGYARAGAGGARGSNGAVATWGAGLGAGGAGYGAGGAGAGAGGAGYGAGSGAGGPGAGAGGAGYGAGGAAYSAGGAGSGAGGAGAGAGGAGAGGAGSGAGGAGYGAAETGYGAAGAGYGAAGAGYGAAGADYGSAGLGYSAGGAGSDGYGLTGTLVSFPNGAVVPADVPAVVAATANHIAAVAAARV